MSGLSEIELGKGVKIIGPINAYGCKIGDRTKIGPFVEIQKDVEIGQDCIISSHSFICSGVKIGDGTFVGHGVMFVNDKFDSSTIKDWVMKETVIGKEVRIGSNATILPVKIGDRVKIGAGSVVTKDVPDDCVVYGNPAKIKNRKEQNV
jgi:UDP-2-acetamido-3-amino-2,3-dideoxy-glucuronate N-acetyltransferase